MSNLFLASSITLMGCLSIVCSGEFYNSSQHASESHYQLDTIGPLGWIDEAEIKISNGMYLDAIDLLLKHNEAHDETNYASYLLGATYYLAEDYDKSVTMLQTIMSDSMFIYDCSLMLGSIYTKIGQFEKANSFLTRAEELKPLAPEVPFHFGLYFESISDTSKALDLYYEAERRGLSSFELYSNIGNLLYRQNRKSFALVYFNRAIERNPTCGQCFYNKGIVLHELKLIRQAIEAWNLAKKHGYVYFDPLILEIIEQSSE